MPTSPSAVASALRQSALARWDNEGGAIIAGADGQADETVAHIAPHPDATHHPLTEHAARQMNDPVRSALHFRDMTTE